MQGKKAKRPKGEERKVIRRQASKVSISNVEVENTPSNLSSRRQPSSPILLLTSLTPPVPSLSSADIDCVQSYQWASLRA
jgi:hypothetical protein